MEWEEQGDQDAEAVQRRPDNMSYPLLKCIVPPLQRCTLRML